MPPLTQDNHQIAIKTPLGKDVLVLASISGSEDLSGLFSFQLQMTSEKDSIPAKDIVGKNVTIRIRLIDGKSFRYFNGYVSRFSAGSKESNRRWYQAEVVPWLWFLTLSTDCRIFQNKSVPDIIKQLFDEYKSAVSEPGFGQYDDGEIDKGNHKPLEYCVQYRETAFNFVSRLMEQEGIFYYFRHEDEKHTLVLADKNQAFKDCPENEVEFAASTQDGAVAATRLTSWSHDYAYTPGKWMQTDYNFIDTPAGSEKTPANLLKTAETSKVKLDKNQNYEVFEYPGLYDLKSKGATTQDPDQLKQRIGDGLTKIRMQEDDIEHDSVQAASNCRTFGAGGKFKVPQSQGSGQNLGGFPQADENKTYIITSIQHSALEPTLLGGDTSAGGEYSNTFTCILDSVTYRPGRNTPKPAIYGVQTAVVVGPKGSEINTDKFGRIQVQFFWDRHNSRMQDPPPEPKKAAKPIWIRVGQIIAGKHWGAMFIPRVGQEVIVTFVDGDPDQPLVTGVVYNSDQMPAYDPKTEPTKSYIKTNSSTGGDGYNELRFEDKKGKEQIFIHSQRNMDTRVRASEMESVGADRHLTVGGVDKDGNKNGDQFEMVYRDRHLKLHRNHTEQIGGDVQLLIGGIDGPGNQDIVVKADKKELIEKKSHLHVKADRNEKVDGNQSLTVGGSQQEKVGTKHAVDAGQEIHLKSGAKVVIEAAAQLSLKVGGNFVDISAAGVTIFGTMVLINSGGAAGAGTGSSPTAPEDAKEAAPTEPTPADSHKTGQKSTPY